MENSENGFVHSIKDGFVRWNEFDGCSTRSEYWYFFLFAFLVLIPCLAHEALMGLFVLIFFFPCTSATIRRLHDSNHSGWNFLWHFLPYIGELRLLYLCCLPSKRDFSNSYWRNWCQYDMIRRSASSIKKDDVSIQKDTMTNTAVEEPMANSIMDVNSVRQDNNTSPQSHIDRVFFMAEKGPNHFNMALSKEGKFEVIMFDIWFALESLRAKGFNMNPKEEIKMIENFLVETCKKLDLPTENKFERIYTLRELTDGWHKEMWRLAHSDYPRTKQYLPGYLYMCFIKEPLIVYPDDSIVEEKLSSVSLSELADFFMAFSEHQDWLRSEIKKIKEV